MKSTKIKIWIDLDNSPHVPFFKPIIGELEKRNHEIIITVREAFQVVRLAELHGMRFKKCGVHYGKNMFMKLAGLLIRTAQLAPYIMKMRPRFSISHGSRSLIILSKILGIPSLTIDDYEYSTIIKSDWLLIPEVIPKSKFTIDASRVFTYPGIKEDVYVPLFRPDDSIRNEFGFSENAVVVTIRPPATEAHYHNPESEELLKEVVCHVGNHDSARIIMVARSGVQKKAIGAMFEKYIASGIMIMPDKVFEGLNLIWYSDLIVSGGGTMNREAAALRVPVYSIFRGRIGAVDRYLESRNLLHLIHSKEEVKKIRVEKRSRSSNPQSGDSAALSTIVATIDKLASKVYF
ncbi:MAG: DUF354 domain-containing protein [Chitinispirillaceae bacterium]|nr:DUF354 domain-containing protein [Chitinispirillaceae bacterium]